MKSPLLTALAISGVALFVGLALPLAWQWLDPDAAGRQTAPGAQGAAPWDVTLEASTPGRSTVFELRLPGSTLGEIQLRWNEGVSFAVVSGGAHPGAAPAALEGYVERFVSAGLSGRLVLAFEARQEDLTRWQSAEPGTPTGTGVRRYPLRALEADAAARSAALLGLRFLPAAGLDAATLQARFGPADQRKLDTEGTEHWLYPRLGLAIALPRKGKAVLQYVAPADFDARLAAPLRNLPDVGPGAPSQGAPAVPQPG